MTKPLSDLVSCFDLEAIEIVGDLAEKGREYNLSRCEGILLFLAFYVGAENFVPTSLGVFDGNPVVYGQFEGTGFRYYVKETQRIFKGSGFEFERVVYVSNSRFYMFLESTPETISQSYVLLDGLMLN